MKVPRSYALAAMVAFREMFSWKRPDNLGAVNGKLAPPKSTPNCVSSQADPADREHYIPPLAFTGDMALLRRTVEGMPGATIIRQDAGYLYAEFRSALMRFVDDVELLRDDKAGVVHVRSASR